MDDRAAEHELVGQGKAVTLAEGGGQPTDPTRQSLPYRTAFETRLDYRGVKQVINRELRRWVKDKRYDVANFDAEVPGLGRGVTLHRATNDRSSGWQLREHTDQGITWISTVTVTYDGRHPEDEWVTISVEGNAAPGVPVPAAKPPRLVRHVLDALDAYDGDAELRSAPTLITSARAQDLLDIVCAFGRRLPVVVASPPPDVPFDVWRQHVAQAMWNLPGLASMYVLDPIAATAFNEGIGHGPHRIAPGDIRTYLPGTDPAVDDDALRHKVLSRRRLEADPISARRLLATVPRRLAATSVPPAAATRLSVSQRDFARAAARAEGLHATGSYPIVAQRKNSQESSGSFVQPPEAAPSPEVMRLREENRVYESLLDEQSKKEEELRSRIETLSNEVFALAHELEVTQRDRARHQAHARQLQNRLVELRSFDDAYAAVDEPAPAPQTFSELLVLVEEHRPWVVVTGDWDKAAELDDHPPVATWCHTVWEAVLAMRDYAEHKQAHGFEGDFEAWCKRTPPGHVGFAPGKVARDETNAVANSPKHSHLRVLPVPTSVDPSGQIFMGAHIKIGQYGMVSPRLYFHDATRTDGSIYIGYIGAHPTNTHTS